MFDLSGQVALVTGGSRGLGFEMASALAGRGADLVIASRTAGELSAARERLRGETGRSVLAIPADLTDPTAIRDVARRTLDQYGRIDILVNNAGTGMRKPLLEVTDEEWSGIVTICLTAPFQLTRELAPHMLAAGHGRIINISSALGTVALPERAAYCAAKGGLLQLTKVMALEWARSGVTVNAICPGPFKTPYNLRLQQDPALYESYLGIIPQHRWGELSEIRAAVVYLASKEASFVTGTALHVDGGWTAHGGTPIPGAREIDEQAGR